MIKTEDILEFFRKNMYEDNNEVYWNWIEGIPAKMSKELKDEIIQYLKNNSDLIK